MIYTYTLGNWGQSKKSEIFQFLDKDVEYAKFLYENNFTHILNKGSEFLQRIDIYRNIINDTFYVDMDIYSSFFEMIILDIPSYLMFIKEFLPIFETDLRNEYVPKANGNYIRRSEIKEIIHDRIKDNVFALDSEGNRCTLEEGSSRQYLKEYFDISV